MEDAADPRASFVAFGPASAAKLSRVLRVINGADAARFCRFLADRLAAPRDLE